MTITTPYRIFVADAVLADLKGETSQHQLAESRVPTR
jgi:hypothetical protein